MLKVTESDNYRLVNFQPDGYGKKSCLFSDGIPLTREDSPSELEFIAKFGKKFLYFFPNFEIDEIDKKIKNIGFSVTASGTVFFIKDFKELKQIRSHYYSYDNHDRLVIVPQENSNNFSISLNIHSIMDESDIYFEEFFDGDGYEIFSKKYSLEDLQSIAKKLDNKAKAPLKHSSGPWYAYLFLPITLIIAVLFIITLPFILLYSKITGKKDIL